MSVADEVRKFRELLGMPRRQRIDARVRVPEVLDPIPLELPVGYNAEPSMRDLVQEYVRGALSQQAAEENLGTFEEEDDFEEENPELLDLSGYEITEFEMVDENPAPDAAPPGGPPGGTEVPPSPDPSPPPESPPVAVTESTVVTPR